MDAELAIRDAVIEDAPAIARVNYVTWLHAYRRIIPDSELESLNIQTLTENWKKNLRIAKTRLGTLVVTNSELIVAYSRFYPSVDPDDDQDQVATIGSMYVHPEFQRKGVGHFLMNAVLEAIKKYGFTQATLHVLAANAGAREFYEGLGWKMDWDADINGSSEGKVPKVRYRKDLL